VGGVRRRVTWSLVIASEICKVATEAMSRRVEGMKPDTLCYMKLCFYSFFSTLLQVMKSLVIPSSSVN